MPELWNADVPLKERRYLISNGLRHNDYGNTPRWAAWRFAAGNYICWLDDDNWLADKFSLERLADALFRANFPDVAFIPMLRMGQVFMPPTPPIVGTVDTANIVVKREIGRWPLDGGYEADGKFAAHLAANHKCAYLPHLPPTIVMEKSNHGR